METPMRRTKLERKNPEFLDYVLQKADDIYIGFSTEDAPYVLPLNFAYINGKIYFHSALEGRKLECIKKNPKVGFCATTDVTIIPEEATTIYNSVVGTGHAVIVEDEVEKGLFLDSLSKRYNSTCEHPATESMIMRTAVIRIDIDTICGKEKKTHIPLSELV